MRRRSLLGLAGVTAASLAGCVGNWISGGSHERLSPDDLEEGDRFGTSIAASGDTAVVGAPGPDHQPPSRGTVYVFKQGLLGRWRQQAQLTVDEVRRSFGETVDVIDDTAVVLDPANTIDGRPGVVHVFERSGGSWRHETALTRNDVSDDVRSDRFAASASLTEDRLAVGNPHEREDSHAGYVHVFERSDDRWLLDTTFDSGDEDAKSLFGADLELSGDAMLVNAIGESSPNGSIGDIYAFEKANGVWTRQTTLDTSPPGVSTPPFYLRDNTALLADPVHTQGMRTTGPPTVYVYEPTDESWRRRETFKATSPSIVLDQDGKTMPRFGSQMASSDGSVAIVGTWRGPDIDGRHGAVYVYDRTDGKWDVLAPPGDSATKGFGGAVACGGETVLAGEQMEDSPDGGAVHVFER